MSVKLREKKLSDGRISLYLDIYHNKKRQYDFLEIYLKGNRYLTANKEKLALAARILKDTEDKLTLQDRGLSNEIWMDADVFEFIRQRSEKKQLRLAPLVKHLKGFTGNESLPFKVITKEWLLAFQAYLKSDTERIENTVNTYMALMNNVLNEASYEDKIPFNPWKKVPSHLKTKYIVKNVDTLEPEEIKKMIEHSGDVHPQVKQCFLFSVFTGLRWSDSSNLTKASIRTLLITNKEGKVKRRKFIVFTQRKTQTQKNLPLTIEAIRMLAERLLDERKLINSKREAGLKPEICSHYFPHLCIGEGDRVNKRHGIMWYELKKWVAKAGIKKRVHFHLTRHTFATLGLEKIGDIRIISDLLGHKKLTTTQRYAHVLDRLKVESIDRMSGYGLLG
jgi:integrase